MIIYLLKIEKLLERNFGLPRGITKFRGIIKNNRVLKRQNLA